MELEESTRKVVNGLVARFNSNKHDMLALQLPSHALGKLPEINPQFASFSKAFPILTRRSFVNTFRQKGLYFNRILQPVIVAIIMAIFFAPLGHGPVDVTSRLGLLQQTAPIVFSGMLNNVALYPFEVRVYYMFRDILVIFIFLQSGQCRLAKYLTGVGFSSFLLHSLARHCLPRDF